MKIVVATHNEHKIKEIKEIINVDDIELVSVNNYDINVDDVEENGETFKDNALLKAQYVASKCDEYIIADDSGLCLDALDILGVKTARYRNDLDYPSRHKIVYDLLKDKIKTASFKCVICLITKDKEVLFFEGEAKGEIQEPKGLNGFGYDPVFYSYELNARFSEVEGKVKNKVSHRGKALEKMLDELRRRGLINE